MRKRVAVFCASNEDTPGQYVALAERFGRALAKNGFDLVWGGCAAASMGAVARGVQACGGRAIGVILHSMRKKGLAYEEADELIIVESLMERKLRMRSESHAAVMLPGGFGTLDEFFSQLADAVIESRNGGTPAKIAVLNYEDSNTDVAELIEKRYRMRLANPSCRALYRILPNIESVIEYLK